MNEIVTLYFSMFRQNPSGSNCGMITTGDPTISVKGSNVTAPGIVTPRFPLAKVRNLETHHRRGKTAETRGPRPFLSGK